MSVLSIALVVVAVVALVVLACALPIVRYYERVVVFRLGRLRGPASMICLTNSLIAV
ncbi:MAG: hypothetical protein ACLPV4_10565 [Solirubrobacteraceae bacterium]